MRCLWAPALFLPQRPPTLIDRGLDSEPTPRKAYRHCRRSHSGGNNWRAVSVLSGRPRDGAVFSAMSVPAAYRIRLSRLWHLPGPARTGTPEDIRSLALQCRPVFCHTADGAVSDRLPHAAGQRPQPFGPKRPSGGRCSRSRGAVGDCAQHRRTSLSARRRGRTVARDPQTGYLPRHGAIFAVRFGLIKKKNYICIINRRHTRTTCRLPRRLSLNFIEIYQTTDTYPPEKAAVTSGRNPCSGRGRI